MSLGILLSPFLSSTIRRKRHHLNIMVSGRMMAKRQTCPKPFRCDVSARCPNIPVLPSSFRPCLAADTRRPPPACVATPFFFLNCCCCLSRKGQRDSHCSLVQHKLAASPCCPVSYHVYGIWTDLIGSLTREVGLISSGCWNYNSERRSMSIPKQHSRLVGRKTAHFVFSNSHSGG